jgi:putative transposase
VIGQPRSSQRYVGCKASRDGVLVGRMITLSRENPRYGYRRIWALLRGEGWQINKKRVHRLWKEQGLRVTAKQRKRRRRLLGHSENSCTRKRAEYKDHVWSYDDFVMDRTEDGRTLKMMPIVDEYTRECLCIKVERSITAKEEVVETLAALFAHRGEPAFIRSDNAVRSSSPRPSSVGSRSQELRPSCTLSRVLRGRTPTQRPSTAALETNC